MGGHAHREGGRAGVSARVLGPARVFVGPAGGLVGRAHWSGVLALLSRLSFVVRAGVFVGPASGLVGTRRWLEGRWARGWLEGRQGRGWSEGRRARVAGGRPGARR